MSTPPSCGPHRGFLQIAVAVRSNRLWNLGRGDLPLVRQAVRTGLAKTAARGVNQAGQHAGRSPDRAPEHHQTGTASPVPPRSPGIRRRAEPLGHAGSAMAPVECRAATPGPRCRTPPSRERREDPEGWIRHPHLHLRLIARGVRDDLAAQPRSRRSPAISGQRAVRIVGSCAAKDGSVSSRSRASRIAHRPTVSGPVQSRHREFSPTRHRHRLRPRAAGTALEASSTTRASPATAADRLTCSRYGPKRAWISHTPRPQNRKDARADFAQNTRATLSVPSDDSAVRDRVVGWCRRRRRRRGRGRATARR